MINIGDTVVLTTPYSGAEYVWELWDGRVFTTLNPTKSVNVNYGGTLTYTTRSISDNGTQATSVKTIVVNQPPLISAFVATQNNLQMPFVTQLTVTATDPESASLTYAWTQDGTPVGSNSPSVTALMSGNAPVTSVFKVTITDADGGVTVAQKIISGRANVAPFVSPIQVNNQDQSHAVIRENGKYIFTIFSTDPDGNNSQIVVDWSASSPTIYAAITATNTYPEEGQLRSDIWVDLAGISGDYVVVATVTDGLGIPTTTSLPISVRTNSLPVVDQLAVSSTAIPPLASVYYTIIAHDVDYDPLTFDWYFNAVGPVAPLHLTGASVTYGPTNFAQSGASITGTLVIADDHGGSITIPLPVVTIN